MGVPILSQLKDMDVPILSIKRYGCPNSFTRSPTIDHAKKPHLVSGAFVYYFETYLAARLQLQDMDVPILSRAAGWRTAGLAPDRLNAGVSTLGTHAGNRATQAADCKVQADAVRSQIREDRP